MYGNLHIHSLKFWSYNDSYRLSITTEDLNDLMLLQADHSLYGGLSTHLNSKPRLPTEDPMLDLALQPGTIHCISRALPQSNLKIVCILPWKFTSSFHPMKDGLGLKTRGPNNIPCGVGRCTLDRLVVPPRPGLTNITVKSESINWRSHYDVTQQWPSS
jgi:hypothetical protein